MSGAPSGRLIDQAVRRLRAGGLVAFPTETVYGLGADALNPEAVAKVFALKGRPSRNPLIVHVGSIDIARAIVAEWTPRAEALAKAFWPGPLTIVLPRAPVVPDIVTGGGNTVGVRQPDHPLTLELLRAFGGPLVGPSANPSGTVSPTTAEHVHAAFDEAQVLTLDGGPCARGIESTVVSLVGERAHVLRPGWVSAEEIGHALGETVDSAPESAISEDAASGSLASPGLLARHYAPSAPAMLVSRSALRERLIAGGRIVAITHTALAPAGSPDAQVIAMPSDAAGYAAKLYDALREADGLRPEQILIERPEEAGALWDAIRDRLMRATTPRDS